MSVLYRDDWVPGVFLSCVQYHRLDGRAIAASQVTDYGERAGVTQEWSQRYQGSTKNVGISSVAKTTNFPGSPSPKTIGPRPLPESRLP